VANVRREVWGVILAGIGASPSASRISAATVFRSELTKADYVVVRQLGDEYFAQNPRSIV
jgi:hypothetical protein